MRRRGSIVNSARIGFSNPEPTGINRPHQFKRSCRFLVRVSPYSIPCVHRGPLFDCYYIVPSHGAPAEARSSSGSFFIDVANLRPIWCHRSASRSRAMNDIRIGELGVRRASVCLSVLVRCFVHLVGQPRQNRRIERLAGSANRQRSHRNIVRQHNRHGDAPQ